jgi:hypothetical protein
VSQLGLSQGFTGLSPTPASFQVIDNIVVGTSFNDVLTVPASAFGDFNNDGVVDTADYIVWRKNGGTQQGYITWRAHFGAALGSGSSAAGPAADVPEPANMVLAAIGLSFIRLVNRRRTGRCSHGWARLEL